MHKLDYGLDGEISVMINLLGGLKLSESINSLLLMMIGKVIQNSAFIHGILIFTEHHECIVCEIVLSHFYRLSAK